MTRSSDGENFVISNGVRLWTLQTGQGFPVMLCNGGPGCCDYLEPVSQMLDDVAQTIRFEQRGCGRSEVVPPFDIETCLVDLESIRAHTTLIDGLSAATPGAPILRCSTRSNTARAFVDQSKVLDSL